MQKDGGAPRRLGSLLSHLRPRDSAQTSEFEVVPLPQDLSPSGFGAEIRGLSIHDVLREYPLQTDASVFDKADLPLGIHDHAAALYTASNPHLNPVQRRLQEAVREHRLLLFRGQLDANGRVIDAATLRDFAQWFGSGEIHSAHNVHQKAEAPEDGQLGGGHKDIFRVSNDPDHGCWEKGEVRSDKL